MKNRIKLPGSLFVQCLVADLVIVAIDVAQHDTTQMLVSWQCLIPFLIVNLVLATLSSDPLKILNALRITFNFLTILSLADMVYIVETARGPFAMLGAFLGLFTITFYLVMTLTFAGVYRWKKKSSASSEAGSH